MKSVICLSRHEITSLEYKVLNIAILTFTKSATNIEDNEGPVFAIKVIKLSFQLGKNFIENVEVRTLTIFISQKYLAFCSLTIPKLKFFKYY